MKRTVLIAGRLAAVGLIVGLGLWMLKSFSQFMREGFATAPTAKEPVPAAPAHLARFALPEGGWQLGSQPFRLKVAKGTHAEMKTWMQQTPPPRARSVPLTDEVRVLFGLVDRQPEQDNGNRVLRKDDEQWRAVLYLAENTGSKQWLLARAAIADGTGSWILLEAVPVEQGAKEGATNRLLPLPQRSLLLAVRADDKQRVAAELVKVSLSLAQLTEFWRQQGWAVRELEGPALGECERNGTTVQYFAPGAGAADVVLFLLRG